MVGGRTLLTTLFSLSATAYLMMLVLLRTGFSLSYINAVSILIVFSLVSILAAATGGVESPVTSWMIVLPLLTAVLMRGMLVLIMLFIQSLPLAIFVYCAAVNIQMPHVIDERYLLNFKLFAVTSAWLVGILSVASHRHWQIALNSALTMNANIDPLTDLMSRGHFGVQAEQTLKYASRDRDSLSVLMIDLDRLKQINDKHGHGVGDHVISLVARIVQRELRATDFCGRIGGDEFCAVLPGVDQEGAQRVAARLRDAVKNISPRRLRDIATPVSISVGVASYDGIGDAKELEYYISRADQHMYQHKAVRKAVL